MQVLEIQKTMEKSEGLDSEKDHWRHPLKVFLFSMSIIKLLLLIKTWLQFLDIQLMKCLESHIFLFSLRTNWIFIIIKESLRKEGKDSVYECCLLRKDGLIHWFLIPYKQFWMILGDLRIFCHVNGYK